MPNKITSLPKELKIAVKNKKKKVPTTNEIPVYKKAKGLLMTFAVISVNSNCKYRSMVQLALQKCEELLENISKANRFNLQQRAKYIELALANVPLLKTYIEYFKENNMISSDQYRNSIEYYTSFTKQLQGWYNATINSVNK